MSKVVKGLKKGVKKIFKGVKKVFKKITSSTIGKVILGAALIYFGGAALGYWGGAGTGAGAGAGVGLTGTEAAATAGATTLESSAAMEALAASQAGGTVAQGALMGSGVTGAEASALMAGSSGGGLWAGAADTLKGFTESKAGQAAIAGGVAAAFSPNEIDLAKEQERLEKRRIARANQNYAVGGLNIGFGVANNATGGLIKSKM